VAFKVFYFYNSGSQSFPLTVKCRPTVFLYSCTKKN